MYIRFALAQISTAGFSGKNCEVPTMTSLQCDVKSCANYRDNCCCRPSIQVEGSSACGCSQTYCSSFQEKAEGASNSGGCSVPNTALDIRCSAKNCVFQKDGGCTADMVSVCGCTACCKDETECASFRMR